MEITYHTLPLDQTDLGMKSAYLHIQTPKKYRKIFSKLVNNIQDKFDQHRESKAHELLVGQMKHEYFTPLPNELEPFILEAVINFHKNNDYIFNSVSTLIKEVNAETQNDKAWINFQQKYEYNPLHLHSGVLSWVYYHKIPYLLEEEDKRFNDPTKEQFNGRFVFYPTVEHYTALDIDSRHEGTFIMFPSSLHHTVYPFYTSDEYRITIAGNVGLTIKT